MLHEFQRYDPQDALAAQLLLHPHELRNRVQAGGLLAGASIAGTTVAIQRLQALRSRK